MNTQKLAQFGDKCGCNLRSAAVLVVVLASAACAHADDPFGLGDAGVQNFAVLNLSNQFTLNGTFGAGVVNGNVGVSSAGGGSYDLTSPATINGQLITNSGVTGTNTAVPITGGTTVNNTLINTAVTDAHTASITNAGLTPTTTVAGGQITGDTTITGHAGQNVLNVTGVNTNHNTITLNAPAGSTFVINDSGNFVLKHTQIDLTGGLTANDVLFNITDSSGQVLLQGYPTDSSLNGILLADGNAVNVDPTTVNGEVIGNQINLSNGAQVNDPYTGGGTSVVPEPSSVVPLILGIALLGMMVVARKQRQIGFGPIN